MTGSKGPHRTSRFIRHRQWKRALGIQSSGSLFSGRRMRGRDRRRGTWWDLKLNCIAIEGQDFAQDTQEGGADDFFLIVDSDEERVAKASSLVGDDDEFVPETESQDLVTESRISGPFDNQGHKRLSTMFREWRRIISDVENESSKVDESAMVQSDSVKLEKESAKVKMESSQLEMGAKVQMGAVKLDMESDKLDTVKIEKEHEDHTVSFSDLETDDEGCSFLNGVDLRGYSQVEDDDYNEQETD